MKEWIRIRIKIKKIVIMAQEEGKFTTAVKNSKIGDLTGRQKKDLNEWKANLIEAASRGNEKLVFNTLLNKVGLTQTDTGLLAIELLDQFESSNGMYACVIFFCFSCFCRVYVYLFQSFFSFRFSLSLAVFVFFLCFCEMCFCLFCMFILFVMQKYGNGLEWKYLIWK